MREKVAAERPDEGLKNVVERVAGQPFLPGEPSHPSGFA
jgi:hypothetical protein